MSEESNVDPADPKPLTWDQLMEHIDSGRAYAYCVTTPSAYCGHVRVANSCAAGDVWFELELLEGSMAGKRLWVCEGWAGSDDSNFGIYMCHTDSDGFLFNPDPRNEVKEEQTNVGGDCVWALHEAEFMLWEPKPEFKEKA